MRHLLLLVVLAAQAAAPPVDPETRFEAASIKPFDPSGAPRMSTSPGRYDVAGVGLPGIVSQGLRVPPNRIIGLPDWSFKELYTISAKAPEGTPSTDPRAMFVMVGNLLKDRFKMATHTEMREMPVFHIVFARTDKRFGPALKESSAERQSARVTPGLLSFSGAPMAVLAGILTPSVGRPVFDKTGLTSRYDFTLKWAPDLGSVSPASILPPGATPPPADPDAPNLFTAIQEQLGLKLESARGPVEVIVIDRFEKPTLD